MILRRETDRRGEEDVEDVGDGGPKLETGIRVCGEGAVELFGKGDAAWLEVESIKGDAAAAWLDVDVARGGGKPCSDIR